MGLTLGPHDVPGVIIPNGAHSPAEISGSTPREAPRRRPATGGPHEAAALLFRKRTLRARPKGNAVATPQASQVTSPLLVTRAYGHAKVHLASEGQKPWTMKRRFPLHLHAKAAETNDSPHTVLGSFTSVGRPRRMVIRTRHGPLRACPRESNHRAINFRGGEARYCRRARPPRQGRCTEGDTNDRALPREPAIGARPQAVPQPPQMQYSLSAGR